MHRLVWYLTLQLHLFAALGPQTEHLVQDLMHRLVWYLTLQYLPQQYLTLRYPSHRPSRKILRFGSEDFLPALRYFKSSKLEEKGAMMLTLPKGCPVNA